MLGLKHFVLRSEARKLYRDVLGLELWASNMEEALFAKFPVVKLPL